MIRRINIFGGPGVGKSTLAADIYSFLSKAGRPVELVREFVKGWAYDRRRVDGFENVYTFGQQLREEYRVLKEGPKTGIQLIVTDSPIMLQVFYSWYYGLPCEGELLQIAREFEAKFPSYNVYLPRYAESFLSVGRNETWDEAVALTEDMWWWLGFWGAEMEVVSEADYRSGFQKTLAKVFKINEENT